MHGINDRAAVMPLMRVSQPIRCPYLRVEEPLGGHFKVSPTVSDSSGSHRLGIKTAPPQAVAVGVEAGAKDDENGCCPRQ